jgi:transcriptional repressor NrdR
VCQEEPAVICPFCGVDNDRVVDSRSTDQGLVIRRRRQCVACGRRYTTYERVEKTARLMVIKKDGSRVPFDPQSILRGIQAACGKRPVSEQTKVSISQEIEEIVHRDYDREVPSAEIGRLVAARLRDADKIAYIRYASEHYDFRTLQELADELADLQARPPDLPNQQALFEA